ncbi:MAG: cyclic nucleotide-binding domain-containing protein [Myxococcota bacterium]
MTEAERQAITAQIVAGKVQDAVAALRVALGGDPGDVWARQRLAEMLARQGRVVEAVVEYERLADALTATGEALKAMAILNVILKLDPKHTRTQRKLAELYARKRSAPTTTEPRTEVARVAVKTLAVPAAVARLPSIPLFSDLGRAAFLALAARTRLHQFAAGHTILTEGAPGSSMFVVVRGAVTVLRRFVDEPEPHVVARLGEGAVFGEMALLTGAPRVATVTAAEECELLELTREQMAEVTLHHPGVARVLEKFCRQRVVANLIAGSPVFKPLGTEARDALVSAFKTRDEPAGTVLLHQGRAGHGIFILMDGHCLVHHQSAGGRQQVAELKQGDIFGEISVVFDIPITATVTTKTACKLLYLDRGACERLVLTQPRVRELIRALGATRHKHLMELASA